jgi:hypothetical protein
MCVCVCVCVCVQGKGGGEKEVHIYPFLTSVLDGGECLASRPVRFINEVQQLIGFFLLRKNSVSYKVLLIYVL